ncbi:MAG: ferrous iron transporter B [Oscillospiraceae bacterium]|nr:ferrous iron transporter B [Oscillospiraceae bacterium]
MDIRIALAGNPNSGKTTLFNALTGSNQFVGNWPGVTVEKKEGRLKKRDGVIITDLPGIYSLSPYTLEEVVARNYLIGERPDAILNIVDGTNLERNLYLTTQLTELGIPVVVAVNMTDLVKKEGDKIDTAELSRRIGCPVVEISALKETGVAEAAEAAINAAKNGKTVPQHRFSGPVEHALAHIEEAVVHDFPEEQQRWYAVKIFERDEKVLGSLKLDSGVFAHIEEDIKAAEKELDDDAESIITNERYVCIAEIIKACYKKKRERKLTGSDKIDRIVTNRWLGLPIFAAVMFLVYYIAMVGFGAAATDWANDGLFGDGFHLFGIGSAASEEKAEHYADASNALAAYGFEFDPEDEEFDADALLAEIKEFTTDEKSAETEVTDDETLEVSKVTVYFDAAPADADEETTNGMTFGEAVSYFAEKGFEEPDPAEDGVWVPGVPALADMALLDGEGNARVPEWLYGLIRDGIIAGVGAVLGFVPQMLVLFFLLAILEACGYMARIAFVLDRIFRRFGLSGKSFIPMLVGTGCGIPGIMASRTIESERDRRMTIMTTTFIPCGAKLPFIAMVAGALFGGSAWVAVSAYFIGMAAIVVSGIMLKKTKRFAGDPAPFVMELPAYHLPTLKNVLRSTWERGWSFIKKAGTIILLSTIVVWFTSFFGWADGSFRMLSEEEMEFSVLAHIGKAVAWIFAPLGWGNWKAAVASVTGLVAKENIVGTMGILYGDWMGISASFATKTAGFSFLVFNLLCAPCFAAIGAIRREMNNAGWTWFAIGYQCGFAYAVALMINQFGNLLSGSLSTGAGAAVNTVSLIAAFALLAGMIYMLLLRKYREATRLTQAVKV